MMDERSIYRDFGKRLAALRKEKSLSQASLAQQLGMPQSTYAGYETGSRRITLEFILRLAKFFCISPSELVTGEEFKCKKSINLKDLALLKQYHALNRRGKAAVDMILRQNARAAVILLDENEESGTK